MTGDLTTNGSDFGPYVILAPLARGGMGDVYRAWDPRLEREVALKILRERSETDPDRVRQFVSEARAASALNHPNIIVVYDAAVDGATPYIVSELVDGEPLRALLARGTLPLKRLLDLATQIADGLADAHAAGIVHRDLKPENIMVTRAGRAKILDFGLARPIGFQAPGNAPTTVDSETATEPGLLSGTVPYMSPEQARGNPVDAQSDQFSFGLILYEMTTGAPAFRRATAAETLDAIANDEPPPVTTLNGQAPLSLCWIIERCLAKNPAERYAITADLHRDLRMLRDRLPEAVAREAKVQAEPSRARLLGRALAIAGALALAGAGAIIWRLASEPQPPDLTALRFTPLSTEEIYEGFPAWSPDGQTIAYAADKDGVLQIYTRRLSSSTGTAVTRSAYDCKHPFWSHDGRRLYYVSLAQDRDGIWSVPAAGGEATPVVQNASRGAISPDGKTLAFLRDEERADIVGTAALWLTNADGSGTPRRYDRGPFRDLRFGDAALWFSPDGRRLGVCAVSAPLALEPERRGWQFWVLPIPDGEPVRRLESWSEAAPRVSSFTWMPDSRHIVLGVISAATPGSGSHLWIADLDGDRVWPLTRTTDNEYYPSASPSGDQIVFTSGEPDYDIVEVALDGGAMRTVVGTSRNEADAVWAPNGDAFAYVTDRAGVDEIWLRGRNDPFGDRPIVSQSDFADRTIMLSSVAFSPDGQRLAYQRNPSQPIWPLRIWYSPVARGPAVPLLPESHQGYQGAPTWSPDSQWIAFAEWNMREWTLVKVRVGGNDPPVILRRDGVASAAPHWSPAGDWITWETSRGPMLVSARDGVAERPLSEEPWLVHTWSKDGSRIYAVRQTEDLRLALVAIDVRSTRQRVLADLGPSPPVNNPLKGLSVSPDGRTLLTSLVRMRGDLWLVDGFRPPAGILSRLRRSP